MRLLKTGIALLGIALLGFADVGRAAVLAHGGSGVVSLAGVVGSVRIDRSTPGDVVAFAGEADFTGIGDFEGPAAQRDAIHFPYFLVLGYNCGRSRTARRADPTPYNPSQVYCETAYYFRLGTRRFATGREKFSAFRTGSARFLTAAGTSPGMRQAIANAREHATPEFACHRGLGVDSAMTSLLITNSGGHPVEHTQNGVTSTTAVVGGFVSSLALEGKRHPVALLFC